MAEKESSYGFEETMVTLTDEDGLEKDFYVDEIYEVDGRLYAAVIPADVENVTEYYVFRLIDLGNDDFEMEDIEEEAEYDAAADAYEEILDTRMWNRESGRLQWMLHFYDLKIKYSCTNVRELLKYTLITPGYFIKYTCIFGTEILKHNIVILEGL